MAEAVLDRAGAALPRRRRPHGPDADPHHRRRRGDREGVYAISRIEGLIARVVGGNFGLQVPFMRLVRDELIDAYNFPQGVMSQLCRAMAREAARRAHPCRPEHLHGPAPGWRAHERTDHPSRWSSSSSCREAWLFYRAPSPPNVAIIRGTTADEDGYVSMEHEAHDARGSLDRAGGAQCRRHRDLPGEADRQARLDPSADGQDPRLPDRPCRARTRSDADLRHGLRSRPLRRDPCAGRDDRRQIRSPNGA